jgi:hypothetical protein
MCFVLYPFKIWCPFKIFYQKEKTHRFIILHFPMSTTKREYLTVKDPQALATAFESGSLIPMCTLGKVSKDDDGGPCVFYDLSVYDPIAEKKKSVTFHLPKCFNESMQETENERTGKTQIMCDTTGTERREFALKVEQCLGYFKRNIQSKHESPDQIITVSDYITGSDYLLFNWPWPNKEFSDLQLERSMRQGQYIAVLGSGYLTRSSGKVGVTMQLGTFLHSTAPRVVKKRKAQEHDEPEEVAEEKETE